MCCLHGARGEVLAVASRQDASDGAELRSVATILQRKMSTHDLFIIDWSHLSTYQLVSYRLYWQRKTSTDLAG